MDYTRQMQKVLNYIETRLTTKISLEDIADIACFSMFHFHRMFVSMVGFTPKDYIRRRRLTRAAKELTFTKKSIVFIATKYQFESQASFTRAFKKQFGITPGKLRSTMYPFARFLPVDLIKETKSKGVVAMDVKIVSKDALKIIGMKTVTTQKTNNIPQLWDKFNQRWQEVKNLAVADACVGVCPYVDMKGFDEDSEFSYIAGMIVDNFDHIPKGMVSLEVPPQKYAVVTHKGTLDNLKKTYQYIYGKWLKESGNEFSPTAELEWYDERFKLGQEDSELDLYIPIK